MTSDSFESNLSPMTITRKHVMSVSLLYYTPQMKSQEKTCKINEKD